MKIDEAIEIPEIRIFIINTMLIEPLEKIINGIINNEYTDTDVQFLMEKKYHFIEQAAILLDIKINFNKKHNITVLNELTKSVILDDFNTLLMFFKKFN